MNKKLLFGIMSLAALAACTNDDFESKNAAEISEATSPIQFEVINGNDVTRASMNAQDKIVWSADQGDLFTLYHGANSPYTTGYENATYKAVQDGEGVAKLTTPSMIKTGGAVMVWPVDTTFRYRTAGKLTIDIDADQAADVENHIPYMSDLINIGAYNANAPYNTEGYNRTYPVYMRPMASQLILHADYAGTDAAIKALEAGEDGIDPIALTSVALQTKTGSTVSLFNISVPVKFSAPAATSKWSTVSNNAWTSVTDFDLTSPTKSAQLTTKCINGTESAKFLILPQANINTASSGAGVEDAAVVFNTTYGKVVVAPTDNVNNAGQYTAGTSGEIADAWYRYLGASDNEEAYENKATSETAGKGYKTTTNIKQGLMQVIDVFSAYKTKKTTSPVFDEPTGAAADRYVKVLLTHLDMDGLHIKTDKQLYDAVRVWKEIGTGNVMVLLDGDANQEFKMSQKTIAKINEINAALAEETPSRQFAVKPCKEAGEDCNTIVITGGGDVQDMTFISWNNPKKADIAFNEGETWNWKGTVKVRIAGGVALVNSFINRGTMNNAETATLKVTAPNGTTQLNVPFKNNGTWNITNGDLTVQFDVTNLGIVNIAQGAEYHQDIANAAATTFTNEALTVPARFFMKDPSKTDEQKAAFVEQIGKVNNSGVFAVTGTSSVKGIIDNYGRIEHMLATSKTYVTTNQKGTTGSPAAPNFASAFDKTSATVNKFGLINLPYGIRESANNVSVSSALSQGFISLTYKDDTNPSGTLSGNFGNKVNYVIVESGISKIGELDSNIKYLEIAEEGTEIVFTKSTSTTKNKFDGLMVLSDVNVQQGVTINISKATFLAAKMYVGGTFTQGSWDGYYGATTSNYTSKYMTY